MKYIYGVLSLLMVGILTLLLIPSPIDSATYIPSPALELAGTLLPQ